MATPFKNFATISGDRILDVGDIEFLDKGKGELIMKSGHKVSSLTADDVTKICKFIENSDFCIDKLLIGFLILCIPITGFLSAQFSKPRENLVACEVSEEYDPTDNLVEE